MVASTSCDVKKIAYLSVPKSPWKEAKEVLLAQDGGYLSIPISPWKEESLNFSWQYLSVPIFVLCWAMGFF